MIPCLLLSFLAQGLAEKRKMAIRCKTNQKRRISTASVVLVLANERSRTSISGYIFKNHIYIYIHNIRYITACGVVMGSFFLYPFSLLWKPQKIGIELERGCGCDWLCIMTPGFQCSSFLCEAMSAVAHATQRPGAIDLFSMFFFAIEIH